MLAFLGVSDRPGSAARGEMSARRIGMRRRDAKDRTSRQTDAAGLAGFRRVRGGQPA